MTRRGTLLGRLYSLAAQLRRASLAPDLACLLLADLWGFYELLAHVAERR